MMKQWMKAVGVFCMLVLAPLAVADFPFNASDPVYGLRSRIVEDPGFEYHPSPEDWRDVNIYQIFTDRFASSGDTLSYIQEQGWYVGDRHYPDNRNFHHGGDWKGLLQNLDYLEGMGVNAVWLSGVQMNWQGLDTRFTPYHYYHPTDFFRVDPAQGTFEDLKNLIDEMHARGMYVILDVVPNHMADLSGLWGNNREDNRYYWPNGNDTHGWWSEDRRHAPPFDHLHLFHNHGRITNWDSYPEYILGAFPGTDDLRTSRQDVRDWLTLAFKNLIDATDVDGFRVDAIKHVEEPWIMEWAHEMRQHAAYRGKHDFIIFGEYFTYDNETLARYARDHGYSFNSALFFPMSQTFMGVFVHGNRTAQLTETLNLKQAYGEGENRLVTFIDNHDVNRIGLEAGSNPGHIEWIMPPALTFLYTATPVPCLFYGTEHAFQQGGHRNGQNAGFDYDDHDHQRETMFDKGFQPGPAQGNKLAETNAPLYQHIAALNRARADNISLRRGNFQERWSTQGGRGPYAYLRTYDDEQALVAFNTADHTESINPEVDKDDDTEFVNVLNPSETVSVSGGRISFSLSGQESKIFVAGQAVAPLWVRNTHHYPFDGDITPDSDIWINTEAGPADDVTDVVLVYRIDEGDWLEVSMAQNNDWGSQGGNWYNHNLGMRPAGTFIEYAIVVEGEGDTEVWDSNNGQDYELTVGEGEGPDLWVRNIGNWPQDGDATDASILYVDAEVGPQGGVDAVTLFYTVDGGDTWESMAMALNPDWGSENGYWFNAALGAFPAGAVVQYYVEAEYDGNVVVRNNGGQYFQVTIRSAPLAITDPAGDITLSAETYDISGTADGLAGDLSWSNALTGASGTLPVASEWTIPGVELSVGANVITISGMREGGNGVIAADEISNYAGDWSDGSNEGAGFGAWIIEGDGEAGTFAADDGFGFWSHEGDNWSAAIRPFESALTEGQTFSIRIQNGYIWEDGGSVGVALRDSGGDEKWALYFEGGATYYAGTDGETDIDWTDEGLDIAFTLTDANSYSVDITPVGGATRTYTGTFTGSIDQVRAWSANNGTDDEDNPERNFFIDHLQITDDSGGSSSRVSSSVTITREQDDLDSNSDGVPDWWYTERGLDPHQPGLGDDVAANGYTYRDLFILDLEPDDTVPAFHMFMGNGGRPSFDAPGGGRRYIVQYTADLNDEFVDIGEALDIGQEIELNGDAIGFYRIRFLDHGEDDNGSSTNDSVSVSATPGSTSFTNAAGIEVTLNLSGVNVSLSTYSINGGTPETYMDGETITVGAALEIDQSVTVELFGETIGGVTDSQSYTYTRIEDDGPEPIALTEVGGTHHWVSEDNQVFINSAGYPEGSTLYAGIIYCINDDCEGDWPVVDMNRNADWENGDWWNMDLGILDDGDTVQFAIVMRDAFDNEVWDNNDGANFFITIGEDNGNGGEPGGMTPPSTNPTRGHSVVNGSITINGEQGSIWTDDNLIAINLANNDPRSFGDGAWAMHETSGDLTHMWAAWDDDNLYLAWQAVDVTDVIDPVNAGSGDPLYSNSGYLFFLSFDTETGGSSSNMWDKMDTFGGSTLPNYQIGMRSDLYSLYLSQAVDGGWGGDDDFGTSYWTREDAGIEIEVGAGVLAANALWGIYGDVDQWLNNPEMELTNFIEHNSARDSFYEMSIPLASLGLTRASLESDGIGVFLTVGGDSALNALPHDPATLSTPGLSEHDSPLEWADGDVFTVPFARIGGSN